MPKQYHFQFYLPEETRGKILQLIDAGKYDYMKDFVLEALNEHLKVELAKLEVEEARKETEVFYL